MKYLTILFLFATTISINAQDIVVNGSGLPGTYSTISAAVQAANSGDKILVSNQAFPYQEDILYIHKGVTILPYSDITHIEFEGDIQITLDSISDLTLIGFDSPDTDIFTVFNDTTRNSLSTVNIVDCHFNEINLDQPKTSLYLSYSTADIVRFSHGDIIGNKINNRMSLGIHDFTSYVSGSIQTNFEQWYYNYFNGNSSSYFSTCDLYENNVRFGNVETYSDTCNIIANNIVNGYISLNTMDFAFNIRNNNFYIGSVKLSCSIDKGINQVVNNNNGGGLRLATAYCSENEMFNFSNVKFEVHNNNYQSSAVIIDHSDYAGFPTSGIEIYKNSISAYNHSSDVESETPDISELLFNIGPNNNSNQNPNPSPAHLNLDLTPNTLGKDGGSDAWSNYHPNGEAGFGTMTGSKARITYLNLPTQIFDPNNIQIKAKAVHGN
jgi:hypothetical protein